MNTDTQLRDQLNRIHRRSYPAYKDLKGSWRFPGYILHIEHVQGDPFAAPSKLSVEVPMNRAAFPAPLFDKDYKRIALQDYLTREFGRVLSGYMFHAKGSGKSGLMAISRCGQQVLWRTALTMDEKKVIARFEVGFPANGRSINAPELEKILFKYLPDCVNRALYYKNLDPARVRRVVDLAEDQHVIRQELKEKGLAAFVANGSVLPRESGVSDKPMKGAVVFESPKTMEVTLDLPHRGKLKGMGIPRGITLIVGGGYHGKSTLLKALEQGIYNHIAGDGREYVITDDTAMKIRAEDGRAVSHVNISAFINHLPNGKDTVDFSTEDASGSTSQAANVVEAVDAGSRLLLIDEDTSATNFMVRDSLMQAVIAKEQEPITPFIDQARRLYEDQGISVILVAGSSGAYFSIADHILQMDTYRALDVTERVRKICEDQGRGQNAAAGLLWEKRSMTGRSDAGNAGFGESMRPEEGMGEAGSGKEDKSRKDLDSGEDRSQEAGMGEAGSGKEDKKDLDSAEVGSPGVPWSQAGRILVPGRLDRKRDQIKLKQFGKDGFSMAKEMVDLKYLEQITDAEQVVTLSCLMRYVAEELEKNPRQEISRLLEKVCQSIEKKGPADLGRPGSLPGNLAQVRRQEIYGCINRYRGWRR